MAIDPKAEELEVRRAGRRGFVMGVTLAELMLIILFALLLLLQDFGRTEQRLGGRESVAGVLSIVDSVRAWAGQRDQTLPEVWSTLIPRVEDPSSDLAERNRTLLETVEDLREQLAESTRELGAANEQLNRVQEQNEDLKTRNEALAIEVVNAKEGGLVLCAFEPPGDPVQVRGTSIPLGTMHLENDGITLIEKRRDLRELNAVDYVGDQYDLTDALDLLETWPIGRKLTFEEFAIRSAAFVAIGDREAEKRQKCRFSMRYYLAAGVNPIVLTGEFERYFFKQPLNSISREEYERLVSTMPVRY